ncbi:MAG: tetratricopeptide repeat protein, partial [bacterium]
ALDLAKELDSALPQTRRDEVTMEVRRRLSRAGDLFRQVGDTVGQIEERRLTRLDKLHRRNAAFYMADTAFEMGDLEAAIRQYEAAAQVYSSDPASLVARMQIVAAHVRLGRWREAAAANERAKRQLATIPDTAFDQPDMPMRREHWERWVEAEMLLAERARQTANVPTGGGGG